MKHFALVRKDPPGELPIQLEDIALKKIEEEFFGVYGNEEWSKKLRGRKVWMINSTATGGGVAEMMPKVCAPRGFVDFFL